jgi:PAS domain S-box-containing protein
MKPFTIVLPFTQDELDRYLEQTPTPVFLVDPEGTVVSANSAMCALCGYEKAALIGSPLRTLVEDEAFLDGLYGPSPAMLPQFRRIDLRIRSGRLLESKACAYRIDSPPIGEDRYLIVLYGNDADGPRVFRHFSDTFMRDVNLGILLIDADYRLVEISDMACRILGLERDKIINRTLDEVFRSVPAEHQLVQRSLLDGLTVRNKAVSWTNNQARYELLMDSNLLKNESGQVVGAYVIFKDVSNIRSLEAQVQRSDRLAMIGQIAAGTAHEIRNPLTSIKGFLQVLKKTLLAKEMHREYEYTEIMLSEIDRINDLVSEFLLLSKPKDSVYQHVDVSAVIRDLLPIINNEAILHNVTVRYEAGAPMPPVLADREPLKQVFLNICKNGIEAMAEVGGGVLTITERLDEAEERIHIDIHDTGPGIPSFLIDKIFDPFFTTKAEGTGLGLSVCQRIIHDLRGTLRVSSKGYGTTFTISLPYVKQSER